ncbi:ABC transporter permease [Elstera litoralis]|uniref:ABC transporter permease n=1 Tax=Elstera litoralis TaxID=552518 RepID=UPI000AD819C1|nr:ABC transporter permease [Elstera litoralis]
MTRPTGRAFRSLLATVAALGQVFPPVAVLAIAVPTMGFGAEPALLALTLYGLLPILENSLTAFDQVPEAVREAGRGSGMSGFQLWRAVELPLAAPLILTGLRLSVTVNVGTAALASTVGAKSLGLPLIIGLNSANTAYVLQGALLVGALALTLDLALARLVRRAEAWRRVTPG